MKKPQNWHITSIYYPTSIFSTQELLSPISIFMKLGIRDEYAVRRSNIDIGR